MQKKIQPNQVELTKTDVGLANVDNTSDANKPVSTAQATAIGLKANAAAPVLSGTITGTYTIGGTPTFPSTVVSTTGTQTMTNKRVTNRVGTVASSATPTPTGDTADLYTITALAANAVVAAPTGTPTNGQSLILRIKDNGTSWTLGWNAIYRAIGVTLPTATVINKTLYIGMIYNTAETKWDVIAVAQEA